MSITPKISIRRNPTYTFYPSNTITITIIITSKYVRKGIINYIVKKYPEIIIGYSGHETGLSTTYAAVALGAKIIERHITLDRSMWGTDHSASVEPHGLESLVSNIRDIELAMGDGIKNITPGEIPIREKLRRIQ